MAVVCPKCDKDDQVRKVSSIITEGSTSIGYSDVLGTLAGTGRAFSQTALAQRLMPPPKPEKKRYPLILAILTFAAAIWLLPIGQIMMLLTPLKITIKKRLVRFFIYLIAGLFLFFVLIGILFLVNITENDVAKIVLAVLLVVIGILDAILVNVGFFGMLIIYYRGLQEFDETYEQRLHTWENKMRVYQNLYYCARDDCVFDPSSKMFAPPERLLDLLEKS